MFWGATPAPSSFEEPDMVRRRGKGLEEGRIREREACRARKSCHGCQRWTVGSSSGSIGAVRGKRGSSKVGWWAQRLGRHHAPAGITCSAVSHQSNWQLTTMPLIRNLSVAMFPGNGWSSSRKSVTTSLSVLFAIINPSSEGASQHFVHRYHERQREESCVLVNVFRFFDGYFPNDCILCTIAAAVEGSVNDPLV